MRMVRPRRAEQLFQRKMRPRSGMPAPQQYQGAVLTSRRCPILALRGPSGCALGRSFARSLTRQTTRKAPSHMGCGKIGRDRAGRSSFFRRKMRRRSGLLAPHVSVARSGIPAAADPRFAEPLGLRWGSHGVALLGSIVPATTFAARLMIIPILTAPRPARIYSALL
jgi:hypothetical protein